MTGSGWSVVRRFLLKDLGLKGISFLLASLLWLQIAGRQTVQTTVSVPLEFREMPADLEISNDYRKQVDLVVRSDTGRNFDQSRLAAVIDLRRSTPGTVVVPLTEENIRNKPLRVDIVSISPSTIRLELERTASKIVKVETEMVGEPLKGYEVTEVKVAPSEVVVTGPESRLQKVSTARTEPVEIGGRSQGFSQVVNVYLDDPRLRIQSPRPVNVGVMIEEKRREVRLRQVRVSVEPEDPKAQLLTRRVDVLGTVPLSFNGLLSPDGFKAVVEVKELPPAQESYELLPAIIPPPELAGVFRTKSLTPARVKVRIRE